MSFDYKSAGVSIEAGEETVDRIKPLVKSTHNDKVLSNIGLFGGFYDAKFPEYEHPILVSSTDGVGTKLKVAFATNTHNTVGQCLVNHCVNDILCCGAKPLFFLDYFATGKLDPSVAVDVISGFVKACKENDCALIGGETAEMPSIYHDGEYDMSGTIVGVVDKKKIVNGSKIEKGDIMIGLQSSGCHTNGYSLARAVLMSRYQYDDRLEELGWKTIGEALLEVHTSYANEVLPLVEEEILTGISHITGGGIIGNTKRIVDESRIKINWDSWQRPALFKLIQDTGNVAEEEMRHVFNLGIGMILICKHEHRNKVMQTTSKHNPIEIGVVE
jgi:phosphoribosylformylglycinamidine cyclo-ligase